MEKRDDTNRIVAERWIPTRGRKSWENRGGDERIGNQSEKFVSLEFLFYLYKNFQFLNSKAFT